MMEPFLKVSDIIDWQQPSVQSKALELARGASGEMQIARHCFEWARDNIQHSADYQRNPVTCAASEVLAARTGYCYAKSQFWRLCFRVNGIPPDFVTSDLVLMTKARRILVMAQRYPFSRLRLVQGGLPGQQGWSRCAVLPAAGAARVPL